MFKIITIPDDAEFDDFEQLGSRSKYWYTFNGKRHLFKMGRPDTGENWSEKVANELCELLGIPHAAYELAVWRGLKGVLSPNFVPEGGRLVHGNELLAKVPRVTSAEQVNRNAPLQLRLLCRFSSPWPESFKPCSDESFDPLVS